MFLTAELVFTIFMLAAEKHKGTFIAPIGIGLSLFVAELTGVYFTGGSVNPARSFGPAVVSHTFASYHWIYWVGPILGSLLASAFYKFIKMLEYETANPGQDQAQKEGEHFNPDEHTEKARVSFAPEDYAMEEGRAGGHQGNAGQENLGVPNEYGTQNRPYSNSPAPPHANDQFAGLNDGGMHGNDNQRPYNPHNSMGGDSDRTVVSPNNTNTTVLSEGSARKEVGSGSTSGAPRSAIKNSTSPSKVPMAERSLRSNTRNNRNAHAGPSDEEIDHITDRYCVNPKRIYAAGKSNGGGFTGTLACSALSSKIAAFAPVSAAFYIPLPKDTSVCEPEFIDIPCKPSRSVPILEFHGSQDDTIAYAGGARSDE
ncbi:putative Aquaporin-1 [Glarea lozoyensis 74030]|uniref:Putative Aquaporin-1 n=1 Tax=Glarea lozoyensis (strain ATCC 74030 / MF5533) TaxID=1104152 RepID=H0EVI6_GLAL7|nr:putative Aquaporin-1 [Glarea lozoyensis 74030]